MRSRSLWIVLVLVLGLASLSGASGALAAGSSPVSDCNAHGQLTQQYSVAQLRTGLSTMPADVKEYTDCYDVIQRQLLAEVGTLHGGSGSGSGGSGGSFLPVPVLIVLGALIVAGATFGAMAVRRRGE
jgi:hypothetical protein